MGKAGNGVFRVLSIDGGGMRGLYTTKLLSKLFQLFNSQSNIVNVDFGKSFDLICGTSTGAILACALAAGIPLKTITSFYTDVGPRVFSRPKPISKLQSIVWVMNHLLKPSADSEILREGLVSAIGDLTLREVYENRRIGLCIPCVNAITQKARVFKTPHDPQKHADDDYKLVDVCMASSAAPIYFPLHKIKHPGDEDLEECFVDGGLWANNPVLVGLFEALHLTVKDKRPIEVVSIGTHNVPTGDPYSLKSIRWGILGWMGGVKIVEMALSAQAFGYSNMARLLATDLKKAGLNIEVIRLEGDNKSPEQCSAIGLDRADKLAISTLSGLAETDARFIHSKVNASDDKYSEVVKKIFTELNFQ